MDKATITFQQGKCWTERDGLETWKGIKRTWPKAERAGSDLDCLGFKSLHFTYQLCVLGQFSWPLCAWGFPFYIMRVIRDNNRVLSQRTAINISWTRDSGSLLKPIASLWEYCFSRHTVKIHRLQSVLIILKIVSKYYKQIYSWAIYVLLY